MLNINCHTNEERTDKNGHEEVECFQYLAFSDLSEPANERSRLQDGTDTDQIPAEQSCQTKFQIISKRDIAAA